MKKMLAILLTGLGFWTYSPSMGAVWPNDGFANFKDCEAVRTWLASVQPTPTTPPQGGLLKVSPGCYYSLSTGVAAKPAAPLPHK